MVCYLTCAVQQLVRCVFISQLRYIDYNLIQALHSTIGNKRYLHDLEKLLEEKLKDLDSNDEQTLLYLAHDISDIGNDASNAKKKFKDHPNKIVTFWVEITEEQAERCKEKLKDDE